LIVLIKKKVNSIIHLNVEGVNNSREAVFIGVDFV